MFAPRHLVQAGFGYGWRLDVSNVRVQTAATLGLAWYGTATPSAFPTYCLQPTAIAAIRLRAG